MPKVVSTVMPAFSARWPASLDRGAVGHRIGERHAELDQIGAGRRQALEDLVADVECRDRRR